MIGGFAFSSARPGIDYGAKITAGNAAASAQQAKTELGYLKSDIERLLMINEALWIFLKEEHGYSDEDLIKKIAEIDMRDGKLDGRVKPVSKEKSVCKNCGRPVGKRRPTCLYCGAALVRDPFER